MATKQQYKQVQDDYYYMVGKYGVPSDLTGGFVDGDHYYELLKNPTITNAYNKYKDLIQYGFQSGEYIWCSEPGSDCSMANNDVESLVDEDERAVEIYNKYC